ncbi:MAG: ribosome small subunit-dependent GTPase A [Cyclobacteriaceae bacterium]|nr:ribosome small subunit-dependent GTPase A [Cyclobacteriaceae bacterium]
MKGLVVKSTGSWYQVADDKGTLYDCRLRGKFRLKGMKTTNPVAVGDRVVVKKDEGANVITEIEARANYIIRQSVKKTGHGHIIAANVDQVMLVVTIVFPRTSLGFIDRFLISAEGFRIPQLLVFNKQDILGDKEREWQQHVIDIYEAIGVKCLLVSAINEEGINEVRHVIANKLTLVAGHSGVGKSTLLNLLAPHIEQKTSEVSDFAQKGVHTTTFAEMFNLGNNTRIIDTPGIKELGLIDTEDFELADYFPEMRDIRNACKFNNCLHVHEPGCEIKRAIGEGEIAIERYESYLSMLGGQDNRR